MTRWLIGIALVGIVALAAVFLSLPKRPPSLSTRNVAIDQAARDLDEVRRGLDVGENPTYVCVHLLSVARELVMKDDPNARMLAADIRRTCELEAPISWAERNLTEAEAGRGGCAQVEMALADLAARRRDDDPRVRQLTERFAKACK